MAPSSRSVVVLPGLDGTGDLLQDFCNAAPDGFDCEVIRYPTDEPLDYLALEAYVASRLPPDRSLILVGESFSGPIALRLAVRFPDRVASVVLCNSFVLPPRAPLLRFAAREWLFRMPVPERILAALMLAPLATPALTSALAAAIRRVRPAVLALRLRELLRVDTVDSLRRILCPIHYLRGTLDRLVTDRSLRVITSAAPSVRVSRIKAPHALLQTSPRDAWAALTSASS